MRISLKTFFLSTTVFAFAANTAMAQQLEEVVVTARKVAENLQAVPINITAFSADSIQRNDIRNVEDIAKFTTGLIYDKGFAPQDTRLSIRGLPVVRGKPPIGVLLDGIDVSSESISTAGGSALMNDKLVDVERIEVVKGPQSALYGRAAFGGAINYVSVKPSFDAVTGSVQLDAATYNKFEGRVAVNVPLVDDKLAMRVNATYSYFRGFYKNTVSGDYIGNDEMGGFSAAFRLKPNDNIDFTFRTSYSDDQSGARPSYYFGIANNTTQVDTIPASAVGQHLGIPGTATYAIPIPATSIVAREGTINVTGIPIALSLDPLTNADFKAGRLRPLVNSLVGDIDLGFATLSSMTGYTTARSFGRSDADFFGATPTAVTLPQPGTAEPLPALFVSDIRVKAEQFSQELRLGSLTEGRLRWAVGGLLWIERYKSDNASLSTTAVGKPAGYSAAEAYRILGQAPYIRSVRNTDHESAYATAGFDITDKLEVDAEARYAHEKVDSVFGPAVSLVLNPLSYAVSATPINPNPEYTTNMFTPKGTVKYKFNQDDSVYATISKGMKPGGYLNVGVVTDTRLARYNPEILWDYELGFKTSWDENRIHLNGAFFHMNNNDKIVQVLVPDPTSPQGASTQAENIGQAKIDGFELQLDAAVTKELTTSISYSYTNARYTSSTASNTAPYVLALYGNCAIAQIGPQTVCNSNTNGKMLDFSAKNTFVASVNYKRPVTDRWDFISEADIQARSHRFLDPYNVFELPGYWNFDLKAGLETKAYSIVAYVTNLFNDLKPKSGQSTGDNYSLAPPESMYTAFAADKRQIGIRANFKF